MSLVVQQQPTQQQQVQQQYESPQHQQQHVSHVEHSLIPSSYPMHVSTDVQPNSAVALETLTNLPTAHVPTQLTVPDATQSDAIQSIVPPVSTSDSTELYYVDKSPCINPNFSKIIELPVTPSPPPIAEEPSDCTDENSPSPSKATESPAHSENSLPKIPISHLIATNQYPSLNRIPPANIVQSFAPVYNNQSKQQPYTPAADNEELYNSYVNNPYNLTLNVEQNFGNAPSNPPSSVTSNQPSVDPTRALQTSNTNSLNMFQSVNYFGNASDASIPPGSEMLFFGNP